MVRIATNSVLHPTKRLIENWKSDFRTSDGPNNSSFIELVDLGIPYDSHYRSRLVLPAGATDFFLNYGLLDSTTFLLIKVTYNGNYDNAMEDDFDPLYRYEPNNYNITYYYEGNSGVTFPIGRLLLLNGSLNNKIGRIYLNNPLDYDVVLDVLQANIDAPAAIPTSSAITISNLYYSDIITDKVICWSFTGSTILRKGPYLIYDGINTEMSVHWQNTGTSIDTFSWGLNTEYTGGTVNVSEYGTDHQHKYTITNLLPSTKYYYKIIIGGFVYVGSFLSAPSENSTKLKFLTYGDMRTNYSVHNEVAGQMISTYANDPDYQALITCVGDLVTYGDQDDVYGNYWDNEFFNQTQNNIKTMLSNSPFMNAIGNHDFNNSSIANSSNYRKYFQYPYNGDVFYTFTYGSVQFFMLNQYIPYESGSTQYNWFLSELSNSNKPWKIVNFHVPGWSAGGGHNNDSTIQNDYEILFEQYGVKIVFSGHNHYYSRALVNNYGSDVMHITTGGGGAPLYIPNLLYPDIVTGASMYHFCKIDITSDSLMNVEVINNSGATIDSFSITQIPPTTTTTTTQAKELMRITKEFDGEYYKFTSTGNTIGLFDYYVNGEWIFAGEDSNYIEFTDLTDIERIRFYFNLNNKYYGTFKSYSIEPIDHNTGIYFIDITTDAVNIPYNLITGSTSGTTVITGVTSGESSYVIVHTGSTAFIINEYIPNITGYTIYTYTVNYNTIISISAPDFSINCIYLSTTTTFYTLKFLTEYDCSQAYCRMTFAYSSYFDSSCKYLTSDNIYQDGVIINCS